MKIVITALKWYSGMAAVSLAWLGFRQRLHWALFLNGSSRHLVLDCLIGMGLALGLILLSRFASRNFRWAQLLEAEFRRVLSPLSAGQIVFLGAYSGLAEELFFRGTLQSDAGLTLGSLLFGAAHLVPRKKLLPWSLYATLVGFLFGAIFQLRQTLLPVILAHALLNTVLLFSLNRSAGVIGAKPQ
jgi:membrane protease YdiL (CAAX protease family)